MEMKELTLCLDCFSLNKNNTQNPSNPEHYFCTVCYFILCFVPGIKLYLLAQRNLVPPSL